jgi:hypothetical protein
MSNTNIKKICGKAKELSRPLPITQQKRARLSLGQGRFKARLPLDIATNAGFLVGINGLTG